MIDVTYGKGFRQMRNRKAVSERRCCSRARHNANSSPHKVSEHGRGLQLVKALSIRWGYCNAEMGTKVVWCELSRADPPATNGGDNPTICQQTAATLGTHFWNEHA
jgi:hypothetical protein